MEHQSDENISKRSPERSSLVFTFLPMALVVIMGVASYLLTPTSATDFTEAVSGLALVGLPIVFGASMRKVRGFVMSAALATAVVVGWLLRVDDVIRQFDDSATFIVLEVAGLTILVLFAWLGGVVIASLWRWTGRRWSTRSDRLKRLITAVVLSFGSLWLLAAAAAATVDTVESVIGPSSRATGAFGPAGSLAEPRLFHTATAMPDGRVLVVGGAPGVFSGPVASAEVWDPTTATFVPAGPLAEARSAHTATLLPDGRVLVVGGMAGLFDDDPVLAEVWDPTTATFSAAGSLAQARDNHAATLLPDGRVLVVGGFGYSALASAEVWDPVTESFSPAGTLAEPRRWPTATLLPDGRVLVVGGAAGFLGGGLVAAAEVWDPVAASFSPAGALAEARKGHAATLLPDGRILVVGGQGIDGFLALAEVWDPSTGSFGPAGSLAQPRGGHTATLVADGRVLVIGGVASAEVWDSTTASFGFASALVEPRFFHTATLLSDGRILVVGGRDLDGLIATAEVWEPSDG